MNCYLSETLVVLNDSEDDFTRVWQGVCSRSDYYMLVWGSVVEPRDSEPDDVDIMFVSETELSTDEKESLSGTLDSLGVETSFGELDPCVVNEQEVEEILEVSRVSDVFSVDEEDWVSF